MEDPNLNETPNLAATIAQVMQDIGGVPKNGVNDYHNYQYPTDDDVMSNVRPTMAKHGLVAIPSVIDRKRQKISTGPDEGDYTLHTDITLNVTLIDAESGEQMSLTWEGEAQDGQDKGLYKAYTSAIKYLMLKLFLQSADADVETHDAASEHGGGSNGRSQDPTEAQLDYARDLAKKDVWTDQEREALLNTRIPDADKDSLSDLIDHMQKVVDEGREVLNGG